MLNRVLLTCLLLALFIVGCGRQVPKSELRVLCGSSMAAPAQTVAELFQDREKAQVLMDLGGSETLLPKLLAGVPADVFICHDPFEQKVKEAGLWAGSARVGVLKPVLLVRPGNPLGVKSVADLTNSAVKIGIGDPRYSTCGEMFVAMLDKKGMSNQVMKQVVLQARTHSEIANGLILGSLDAAIVWNFIAQLYTNKVQLVPTTDAYPEIHVTVVGLKPSENPKLRDRYVEFCRTPQVQSIFAAHGYNP